jgi:hypothetical protein
MRNSTPGTSESRRTNKRESLQEEFMALWTNLVFEEMPEGWKPTGTYCGGRLPKPERMKVGDTAVLKSSGVSVLVKVGDVNGSDLAGEILAFESYEEDTLDGCRIGDTVRFSIRHVECWIGR